MFCSLTALFLAFYCAQLAQARKFSGLENAASATRKRTNDRGKQKNTLQRSVAILAEKRGARPNELVIGRVSDDLKKHYKRLKPMVDYVAGRMGDLGWQSERSP